MTVMESVYFTEYVAFGLDFEMLQVMVSIFSVKRADKCHSILELLLLFQVLLQDHIFQNRWLGMRCVFFCVVCLVVVNRRYDLLLQLTNARVVHPDHR